MPATSSASERLQKGQVCYKSGNVVEASHQFRTVAKSCSCQTGKPNLQCVCVDFLIACKDRNLDGALRITCKCPRRAQKRCKEESHLTSLGNLVMVAVKVKNYKLGLVYAQNLIFLAPRDPRGYLRLGQVLRLMEKQHTALAVYQQGIGLVTRANAEHPGLRALQDQEIITRKLITQVDPLEVLPAEILVLILGYLNTRHHCRCVKLSKSWKAFMESQVARPLWLYQHFDQVAKTVSKTIKPNMVQRHLAKFAGGQLKSLRVDNCAMIPLVCTKFTSVLRACPHLRRLSLGGHATINLGGHVFDKTLFSKMPRLEFLHLDPHINIPPETLDCLINSSCGTLRELNILKLPYDPLSPAITYPKDWWQLPKLHTLRLAASPDGYNADLDYIMAITPNLETLWLDTIKFATVLSEEPPTICWPELRRVCIGDGVEFALGKSFPRLTQNIEELDVHGTKNLCFVLSQALPASDSTESATQRVQMFDGTSVTRSVEMPVYDFPKLTSVVLKGKHPLTHQALRSIFWSSVENDTLRHLELEPFPWAHFSPRGPIQQWGLIDDSVGLTTLAINCLNGEVGRHVDNADEALLRLVKLFPNLQGLDIGAETVGPQTLGRILESGVNSIYHKQGASMLELKDWARSKGKNVIQGPFYDGFSRFHKP